MMQAQLIAAYEQLLEQSRRILECAQEADWSGIFALKAQGLIDAAQLKRIEEKTELDEQGKRQKLELVRQILELDGEVKNCLRARQDDLGQLMQVNRMKHTLNQAYRGSVSNVIPMPSVLYQKE